MTREQGGKVRSNDKASLCKGVEVMQRNSIFGRYSEPEMLAMLRRVAMDPYLPQFSRENIQPLRNQILRLRKVMLLSDSETPWRKRKLEKFVKDNLTPQKAAPEQQDSKKLKRGQLSHISSISCELNSPNSIERIDRKIIGFSSSGSVLSFEGTLPERHASVKSSFIDDVIGWNFPDKDIFQVVDSDESVNGSNPLTPENRVPTETFYVDLGDLVTCSESAQHGPNRKSLNPPCRSTTSKSCTIDHPKRMVIPVGPRFQAEVPKWISTVDRTTAIGEYKNSSENSKWLGIRVWPTEIGIMKTTARMIGKGRPSSCSCASPGSVDCTRRHILDKRILLKCDLGPAYSNWKFDEMGDQVSKSWTLKEQQTFESLMKMSNRKNILHHDFLKYFPNKCRKSIISYYLNVFVPQRMNRQLKLCIQQVDTDDDEPEDFNYLGMQKRC